MGNGRKKFRILRFLTAGLLLFAGASLLSSRHMLSVSRYTLPEEGLPAEFDGFRIVQLSDLHGADFGRENLRLVRRVAGERPDIIVLTGDFLERGQVEEELPVLKALVEKLSATAPVYFVSGNHDWASGGIEELAQLLDTAGARYLRNEYVLIERGEARLVLAGVEDPNAWADMLRPDGLVADLRTVHPEAYTVLLGHRNDWVKKYPALDVDLIFCGHGHGGIVRLPFFGGALGTGGGGFPEFDAGLFESGEYTMVVSRGLGNSVPIPRFLNRPEIVSVTLKKA